MSIRAKLVVAIVASMVGLAVAMGAVVHRLGERNVRIAAEQAVAVAEQTLAAAERADVEKLDATLRALTAHPGFVEAFEARDRARLLALAAPVFAALRADHDVTHFYFIEPDPKRTCFLRVHRPELFGDVVNRETLTRAIDTRHVGAGKELGKTAFALRVVRPWFGKDGKLLGYMELGEDIDHFLGRMKAQTGDDYALLVEKSSLDAQEWASTRGARRNNWDDRARTIVVDATTADESVIDFDRDIASIPERGALLDQRFRDHRRVVRGIVPVSDASGRRVGGLFVVHDVDALHDSLLMARRGMYALLGFATAVLGVLLVTLVNRLVIYRVERMSAAMESLSSRLAAGDYDVVAPRASADDEIGRFEEFFGRFVQVVVGLMKEKSRRSP